MSLPPRPGYSAAAPLRARTHGTRNQTATITADVTAVVDQPL
ncbi:hypothetical protein AB0E88_01000 [Streptomyces sp. NPDC028635]